MVLTVEPGLYIPPDDENIPEHSGIGVASKTTFSFTMKVQNLTAAVPKSITEVGALQRGVGVLNELAIKFDGRRALVCGASKGIGCATAKGGNPGAQVVVGSG